jgi:glycosyltransferase involved in cell wall biosynthesis
MASSERQRILAVLQGFDQGGSVAAACSHQMEALATRYDCRLISDRGPLEQACAVPVERLRVSELRLLRRFAHVPRQALFAAQVGWHLLRRHRKPAPQLVIFHSHPPTALLAPLLHRFLGCRVLMVMHGDIHDRPAGTYDTRLTWWYRINTAPAYRRSDAVLALSPYMARMAVHSGARAAAVHLVPNGVDAAEIGLGPEPQPPSADPQHLLFVGRLEGNKGIDVLLAAFCRLAPHWPGLHLTCIGSADPRSGLEPLKEQLRAAQLSDRVHWLPPQPREQLGAHYREAALVVVPSRSETQSTVIMEAMAAGRAVLASDTGGNPMLVDHGTTGLLFRSGDAAHLADSLQELLAAPQRLAAMGLAGQQRQQLRFSRQASRQTLLRCIDTLLQPSPGGPGRR